MSKQSSSAIKRLAAPVPAVLLGLAVFTLLWVSGFCAFLDRSLFDYVLSRKIAKSPEPLNPAIVSVDLSDRTEELLGASLDSRSAFSDLLDVLSETHTATALDFLFRGSREADEAFTESARGVRNLVIAVTPVPAAWENYPYRELDHEEERILGRHLWNIKAENAERVPEARTFLMPLPALADAAVQLAHIGITPDSDGIYRRTPLLYKWRGGYIPSLSLAMAVLELGIDPDAIELYGGSRLILPLGDGEAITIPVDHTGAAVIPFSINWTDDPRRISFQSVVRAKTDSAYMDEVFNLLGSGIVLAADTSSSKKDFGPVPFEAVYPLSGIHSAVLSAILNGRFPGEASRALKACAVILVLILSVWFIYLKRNLFFHGAFLGLFTVHSLAVFICWNRMGTVPWFAVPFFLFFLIWLFEFIRRLGVQYTEQLLLKNALSRYFPRSLAQRILAEGKTDLAPAHKEVTILFSDISGFTKWSSDKNPEHVHSFLSEYLESMARILFDYGGTVDKFMGDGILAFFGDPFEQPDHAERCVGAALAMQKKVRELAAEWNLRGRMDLKVRIGINTGKVIAGNLGTAARIEYTVIGAAVNLAQRMESNAPAGGILVARDTWLKVRSRYSFGGRRAVTAKGYDEPVEAYELVL
ncbi:adenylate/guanylate cyclase domain-containing protein [Breznakiella homolactica]|uniref:Adenylate/guanylate cyclase domain-containing protein n=1 Tax=Breznakiella homolactica TaxID=2798577 RepID=A0A7T7XRJ9_9SPIR|nr:adenylate/guanylate cyclase domain-containing protein [Breznakiella homolactica]QQO11168.1 adenylate/guanylate cyclase domain-containing protein [Breznakiella homolactica]